MLALHLQVPIVFADVFVRQQDLTLIQNIDSNSQYAGSHWALGNQAVCWNCLPTGHYA